MKTAVVVSIFALAPFASAASSLAYCASTNTGSSFKSVSDIFQSNGACRITCANYALGIIQGKKCWCSNVAPSEGSQSESSDCDTACPGYPSDSCGSASKGVFAYVEIPNNDVTSTAGGTSTTKTTSSSESSSTSSSTSESTSDQPETVTVTASDSSVSTSQTSTASDKKTTTTSESVSVQTNSGGEVRTITVAGSSPTTGASADSASANASTANSSKLSGGSIAGIVVGVLGGLALIGALIFMIFFYRKRARAVSPIPSQEMTDDRTSRGSSFMGGLFPRGNGEAGAGGSIPARSGTTFTDGRMKTNATLYPNGPRDSSVSLQDNEDYSRPVLRLTNPD
ncbi:Carbohydrate-binding WSC subgroup [Penicillium coprophilum]|uniref:Carbohydrate-binding WSC subgroup n=1 Tax=Penicillium coprophilum TaxID=36646 RepID=UPI002397F3F1|nr:Carbohydrate-binding WSC subgroup [Penicillium coprophilum]KAJ5165406.1 Carbohydrate-binding WSC subgroup [Penicillium coprophilum]